MVMEGVGVMEGDGGRVMEGRKLNILNTYMYINIPII